MARPAAPLSGRGAALPLTSLLGRRVVSADGQRLGRVRDLVVRHREAHPHVERVVLDRSREAAWLPTRTTLPAVVLTAPAGPRRALAADELLLARDVLDTQVVDVAGYHISRVGEVLLAPTGDGGLEAVAVEVGARPVLRRLGLGLAAARMREQALDWESLHLTSARGHEVQLGSPAAVARRLDAEGLAALVNRLAPADAADVVVSVDPLVGAHAVRRLHPHVGSRVIAAMAPEAARRALGHAHPETVAAYEELRRRPHPGRLRRLEGWRLHRPGSRR